MPEQGNTGWVNTGIDMGRGLLAKIGDRRQGEGELVEQPRPQLDGGENPEGSWWKQSKVVAAEVALGAAVLGGTVIGGSVAIAHQQVELASSLGAEGRSHIKGYELLSSHFNATSHVGPKNIPATAEAVLKNGEKCTFNYQTRTTPAEGWLQRTILSKMPWDIYDNIAVIKQNSDNPQLSGTCPLIPTPKKK